MRLKMKLIQKIKIYLTVLFTLLIIDAIWLNIFSANLYKENLNGLISSHTNLLAALLFYLIYAFALSYLIIFDGIKNTTVPGISSVAELLIYDVTLSLCIKTISESIIVS